MTSWIGVKVTARASSRNAIGGRSAAVQWRCLILKRDHSGGGETSRVLGERIELRVWIGKENGALTPTDCFRCHRRTRSVSAVGTAMPLFPSMQRDRETMVKTRKQLNEIPLLILTADVNTEVASGADGDADVNADADADAVVKAVVDVVVDGTAEVDVDVGVDAGVDAVA
ncbi:hypothetical protein SISNIDRAFT_471188 [Sistotremastrum niveocremeum HHB9708]|uniref:Uncharacterized protein n=1 Tax=Sistotremastrum niveocremeum HHB9708 TaxID=1314777 RepID=A0A164MY92_9AGAM|nr:hypothetical protein SISNIDRAFT_471188 [Sistotremastrum niveocremeum HHB9708]